MRDVDEMTNAGFKALGDVLLDDGRDIVDGLVHGGCAHRLLLQRAIEQASDDVLAAVDEFDPDNEAMVLGAGFSRSSVLVGRPVYGARPEAWGALEDKMIIDQLWDDAGVRRAPSTIVPVARAPAAAADLASDLGTVWVADNSEGWHGGGEYVRWIRSPADVAPAVEWFGEHAATVRVMPFLDGIPCSIHGFSTHDGVAVFLPVDPMYFPKLRPTSVGH